MDNSRPQIPAQGISLHKDWGSSKMYHIQCDCGNPEHQLTMDVEADECDVTLNFYVKVESDWWNEKVEKRYDIENDFLQEAHWTAVHFINTLWHRLRVTWKLWVKGYLEYEQVVVLNKQQALNLSNAIGDAVLDVETFRKEKTRK